MTTPNPVHGPGLPVTVALYLVARIGLVAIVTAVLLFAGVPFLIALLVGLVVALPLSMVLFRGLRGRLDAALAQAGRRRSVERSALRARLRGEDDYRAGSDVVGVDVAVSDERPDGQADAGGR